MRAGAAPDHHDDPSWVKVELPAPSHCFARCIERSDEIASASEAEGVHDMTAFMKGRNKELPGIAERVRKSTRREVEEQSLRLSVKDRGRRGRSKVIALCTYLEEKFQECSKGEGVGLATSVETCGVDLRTKQLGAKREGQKEEV